MKNDIEHIDYTIGSRISASLSSGSWLSLRRCSRTTNEIFGSAPATEFHMHQKLKQLTSIPSVIQAYMEDKHWRDDFFIACRIFNELDRYESLTTIKGNTLAQKQVSWAVRSGFDTLAKEILDFAYPNASTEEINQK